MKIIEWLKPGIGVKRWISLGITGVGCISFGFTLMFGNIGVLWKLLAVISVLSGCACVILSIKNLMKTFLKAVDPVTRKQKNDVNKLTSLLNDKSILMKGPKIVTIGGGTGLSTMLRGLKAYSSNITAVVTMADDGGGSGVLREDLGMLPPGDIRNCILALADTEPIMEKLLQYRFQDGMLKGQSFGNLFLAAMDGISGNFEEAVRKMSDVLAVTGRVLPVSLENVKLCAELESGLIIRGESKITKFLSHNHDKIKRVFLHPHEAEPLQEVVDAIMDADIVVLGPGSLYTSIIPNLLVNGVVNALKKTSAMKVYVCNIMTQPGETDGFSALDHLSAIEKHSYKGVVDGCIINTAKVPDGLKARYHEEHSDIVNSDIDRIQKEGIKVTTGNFMRINNGLIRHNSEMLADTIVKLADNSSRRKKYGNRITNFYYANDKLRKFVH